MSAPQTYTFYALGLALEVSGLESTLVPLKEFFSLCTPATPKTHASPQDRMFELQIEEQADGRLHLPLSRLALSEHPDSMTFESSRLVATINTIMDGLIAQYACARHPCSAVAWGEHAILISGAPQSGRTSLALWLIAKGFSYVTDSCVLIAANSSIQPNRSSAEPSRTETVSESPALTGFANPLCIDRSHVAHVITLDSLREMNSVCNDNRVYLQPDLSWQAQNTLHFRLNIYVKYSEGTDLLIQLIPSDKRNGTLSVLAPTLEVRYGNYEQLGDFFDTWLKYIIKQHFTEKQLLALLNSMQTGAGTRANKSYAIPEPSDDGRRIPCKLTIGMATYDDYDGTYFSIQALRMFHPEIIKDVEFVIIDNNPSGACAASLKALENHIPNYRYIPAPEYSSTAIRDRVFSEAMGNAVLCMDCHVFFTPTSIKRLIDYYDDYPETPDLIHGPMVYDNLKDVVTHWRGEWANGMYGRWELDPRGLDSDAEPFEIPMMGLGMFSCRRDAWLGFNKAFRGFGGEEGYIHEKFRQAGARVLCLPFLRWMHRFQRPFGVPYRPNWDDRVRNYLIGWNELGMDTQEMKQHFIELIGEDEVESIVKDYELEFNPLPLLPFNRNAFA